MHLLLTDRLTCSRCGPTFGLILLADRIEERRVLEGSLGCPNCRDRYPINAGFGDLRPPPRAPRPGTATGPTGASTPMPHGDDGDSVTSVAAAMGLGQGGGNALLLGDALSLAAPLAAALPEMEFVVADAQCQAWAEKPGVSRLVCGPRVLPFFDRTMRGVAVDSGRLDETLAREIARVLALHHRAVVLRPGSEVASVLQRVGLDQQVEAPDLLVASR